MSLLRIISALALSSLFVISCSDPTGTATPPADTSNSIWSSVNVGVIPDTLLYGDTALFQIAVGDSDGDSASVTISGIPATMVSESRTDTSKVFLFRLIADSLQFDSLYFITVAATGVDQVDTATWTYGVQILDTARMSGLKKLAVGMWWTTMGYDTGKHYIDTFGKPLSISIGTEIHRKYQAITGTYPIGSQTFLVVLTSDTISENAGISTRIDNSGMLMRQTENSIEYLLLPGTWFIDSITITVLKVPMGSATSWPAAYKTLDTTVRYLTMPFSVHSVLTDTANLAPVAAPAWLQNSRPCNEVTLRSDWETITTADTTITGIFTSGDTITRAFIKSTGRWTWNSDFGIPVFISQKDIGFDTNTLGRVVKNDTTSKAVYLRKIFDPRSNDTVVVRP